MAVTGSTHGAGLVFSATSLVAVWFCVPWVVESWSSNTGALFLVSTATALTETNPLALSLAASSKAPSSSTFRLASVYAHHR